MARCRGRVERCDPGEAKRTPSLGRSAREAWGSASRAGLATVGAVFLRRRAPGRSQRGSGDEEVSMSRSYAEPAQVRRADELPSEFCWRGRLYSVREVLAHWKEARCWWHEVTADRAVGEREYWRVVAAPGRSFSAGV
ncbi:MAG: DUF6504 family protein [Mycobacteriales bacterium]